MNRQAKEAVAAYQRAVAELREAMSHPPSADPASPEGAAQRAAWTARTVTLAEEARRRALAGAASVGPRVLGRRRLLRRVGTQWDQVIEGLRSDAASARTLDGLLDFGDS